MGGKTKRKTRTPRSFGPPADDNPRCRPQRKHDAPSLLPRLRLGVPDSFPILALPWISAAPAADCAPADATLAGDYHLKGVMELGSELRLPPNGRFDYMLAYGALDELASDCRSREGGAITLVASKFETSMEDPLKFHRLELKGSPGSKLERRFDAEHVGKYSQ